MTKTTMMMLLMAMMLMMMFLMLGTVMRMMVMMMMRFLICGVPRWLKEALAAQRVPTQLRWFSSTFGSRCARAQRTPQLRHPRVAFLGRPLATGHAPAQAGHLRQDVKADLAAPFATATAEAVAQLFGVILRDQVLEVRCVVCVSKLRFLLPVFPVITRLPVPSSC